MNSKIASVIIAGVTMIIYFVTVIPYTRSIANQLFLLYIVVTIFGLMYYPIARKNVVNSTIMGTYMLLIFMAVLLWVGVTGWFFSPFFYLLYLLAIVLAFTFSTFVTTVFIVVLLGLFSPNIGSIDMTIDMITVLSLFSVIPLTHFLQKEYLRLKESENKVLILEDERKGLKNQVDEVLKNKVVKFAVDLKQPVNDMRQIAIHAQKEEADKMKASLKKIARLGETSMTHIEKFEEGVTGKKLLHTKKIAKKN